MSEPAEAATARLTRTLVTALGLVALWEGAVRLLAPPAYILPGPRQVAAALWHDGGYLFDQALVTAGEILLGLGCGTLAGILIALAMAASGIARRWLMPIVVVAQALPVFAIAPVLVLWLGFGLASKVTMASLIVFFPVAAAFFDGLRRTAPELTDIARGLGASDLDILRLIRIPAALPALAQGIRAGAAVAPIGAVVGEWVGAAAGLGFVMVQANARMQTDTLFAALLLLVLMALGLWFVVDRFLARALHWVPETLE